MFAAASCLLSSLLLQHNACDIQVKALKAGCDVVVATPGRLEDLVQEGSCRLQGVTYLVLDEADCMLDLSLEPRVKSVHMHMQITDTVSQLVLFAL